jgi:lipopolysaccharide export system permease protein
LNLLTRYLLLRFTKNLITVASGFVAIYLLVDFFEKIDNFNEHGGTLSLALQFFLLNIPFILDQLGPVLILLAGVITFGVLNHSNELRALKAGGIPLTGIISPLLIGALITTTLFFLNAQFILPKTVSTTNHIWYEQLHDKVPLGIYRSGRYYYKGAEGFYSFRWNNTDTFSFSNFSYSQWGEGYYLKYLLSAREAVWEGGVWKLIDGQTQQLMDDGTFRYQTFIQNQQVLPESPDQFFVPEYRVAEMSISDLLYEARDKTSDEDRVIAWANFSSRISYILLGIPLLLLGLPVLIFSYRKWGQDLAIAIPASCLLAFFAWGLWGALQSFAKAGFISPLVSSSAVHLIFATLALLLLRRENR